MTWFQQVCQAWAPRPLSGNPASCFQITRRCWPMKVRSRWTWLFDDIVEGSGKHTHWLNAVCFTYFLCWLRSNWLDRLSIWDDVSSLEPPRLTPGTCVEPSFHSHHRRLTWFKYLVLCEVSCERALSHTIDKSPVLPRNRPNHETGMFSLMH